MATVNKDFKIKQGLVVEGTTATVDGNNILVEGASDQYIIGLIGGETLITSVKSDDFTVTGGELTIAVGSDIARTSDITTAINALTTDDVAENAPTNNLYFTDDRAKAAATVLLTQEATLNNITITSDLINGLVISAENGVADSTTDDLSEGINNLYYTDSRVNGVIDNSLNLGGAIRSAIENAVPDSTDGLSEGINNLYYTDSRVSDAINNSLNIGGAVWDAIENAVPDNTDGLSEGINNLYFTDDKAIGAVAGAITTGFGLEYTPVSGFVIDRTVADTWYEPAGAINDALYPLGAPAFDSYGSAATAEANANAYTDNAVSGLNWKQAVNLLSTTNFDLNGNLPSTIDGHEITATQFGYRVLLAGQTDESENGIYVIEAPTQQSYFLVRSVDADSYDELIGSAVYVMEGTQYGSTSWVQSNHYLSDFTGQSWTQFSGQGSVTAGNGIVVDGLEVSIDTAIVATQTDLTDGLALKQDTLTAGDNIGIINGTISVTGLTTDDVAELAPTNNLYFTDARAVSAVTGLNNPTYYTLAEKDGKAGVEKSAVASTLGSQAGSGIVQNPVNDSTIQIDRSVVDGWYDANGAAAQALTDAQSYTDTAVGNVTIDLSAAAGAYVDWNINTEQFDVNVNDIIAGEDIATNTSVASDITTAINALTTDDVAENAPTNNLYFTDQRAIDALEAVVPNFTAVDLNSVAKQIAATVSAPTAGSAVTAYSFSAVAYRSAKFLIKASDGTHTELTEVLITLDTSNNVHITEYATIGTNGSLMAVIADFDGPPLAGAVRLRVTPTNNNSTVTVMGTLLA